MKKIQGLLVLVAAIALIAVGFLASRLLESGPEVTVSATSIEERLTRCSSLHHRPPGIQRACQIRGGVTSPSSIKRLFP